MPRLSSRHAGRPRQEVRLRSGRGRHRAPPQFGLPRDAGLFEHKDLASCGALFATLAYMVIHLPVILAQTESLRRDPWLSPCLT